MKITQLIVVSILITTASMNTPSALAEECQVSACVDVYTQDGKIIIEGRKGDHNPLRRCVASCIRKSVQRSLASALVEIVAPPPRWVKICLGHEF